MLLNVRVTVLNMYVLYQIICNVLIQVRRVYEQIHGLYRLLPH